MLSMRKWITAGAAFVMAASLLAGCSGKEETKPTPVAGETAKSGNKESVKLKMWGGVPPENGPQQVVDSWNKANPDIQVQYIRYVNDDTGNLKLETALLSQTDSPDIFVTYADERMTKRIQAGMAEPLDGLMEKVGFNVEEIIGKSNINLPEDGKIYYLPASRSIGSILINKSALDEAGEKVPESWTWDEFAELAKKLNKEERKGLVLEPAQNTLGEYVAVTAKPKDWFIQDDGTSNFNNPALKKGLELQKSLEESGVLIKYSEAVAGKITLQNEFLTGKAAMAPGASYLIRYIKDTKNFPHDWQVVFAPFPQYEKGGKVNPGGGLGDYMSINKNSKNKESAMKFLDWYIKKGNMSMVPGGRIPSSKTVDFIKIADLLVGDANNLMDKSSLQNLLAGDHIYPTSHNVPSPQELRSVYKEEMEKYLFGMQPVDKTLETMKTRADGILKSAK